MLKLILFLSVIQVISCLKILVVYPTPSPSHNILGHGFVKHLLEAGHEITYITSQLYSKPHPKLRQIDLTSHYDINMIATEFSSHKNNWASLLGITLLMLCFIDFVCSIVLVSTNDMIHIKHILTSKALKMSDANAMLKLMVHIHNATLTHENVQNLINNDNEQFDLAIIEWTYSEIPTGFAALYNCPYIWSSTLDPHWSILRLVDEATNPAYTVDIASSAVPPLSFVERLTELWFQVEMKVAQQFYVSMDNAIYTKVFGPAVTRRGRVLPPLDKMRYNASLVLSNSYPPLSPPIRLPANFKEIGGFHIDAHVTPLPEDLKKIMDEAKNGVIYFSLGSNIKSKDMPEEMKRDLLKMFGELKQVVLWKFEEELKGLPKNVHILKWAPQPSILAHPNLLVFASHGGLLSLIETIHYGVPVVGIPVFADQFLNINKAVKKGFAIKVTLAVDMATPLKNALLNIINDNKYRETAKRLSSIYHDRLVSPGAELVHWVEHVVRTGGALHLRSPALMVPWYQKIYLDLIVIIIAAAFIIKKVIMKVFCTKINRKLKKN